MDVVTGCYTLLWCIPKWNSHWKRKEKSFVDCSVKRERRIPEWSQIWIWLAYLMAYGLAFAHSSIVQITSHW